MYILVIEDNPDLVANLYDYLERHGHTIDVAYDGSSGLRFAQERRYDVMVLDLMLPGMDGLDVCRHLREAGRDTPVLMLTASNRLKSKLDGLAVGADDFLFKPFALQELEARLTALVRRAQGELRQRRVLLIRRKLRLELHLLPPQFALLLQPLDDFVLRQVALLLAGP